MSEKLEKNHNNVYVDTLHSVEKTVVYKIQDSQDSINTSTESNKCIGSRNHLSCLWLMVAVSIILAIAALIFAGTIVGIDQIALRESQEEVEALMRQIHALEVQLNESHSNVQASAQEQANDIESQLDDLHFVQYLFESEIQNRVRDFNATIRSQHVNLSGQIKEMRNQLQNQLNGSVRQVNRELTAVQHDIDSANDQLDNIHSNVTSLNELLESEVNIYDDCIKESQLCTIEPVSESSRFFLRICGTPWADTNITGYYTVDTHCTYQSNYGSGHLVTSVLHADPATGQVRCRCSVSRPSHTTDSHQALQTNLDSVCKLEITRCPLSQLLY